MTDEIAQLRARLAALEQRAAAQPSMNDLIRRRGRPPADETPAGQQAELAAIARTDMNDLIRRRGRPLEGDPDAT